LRQKRRGWTFLSPPAGLRQVDKNVFRFDPATQPRTDFKKLKPSGEAVDG